MLIHTSGGSDGQWGSGTCDRGLLARVIATDEDVVYIIRDDAKGLGH